MQCCADNTVKNVKKNIHMIEYNNRCCYELSSKQPASVYSQKKGTIQKVAKRWWWWCVHSKKPGWHCHDKGRRREGGFASFLWMWLWRCDDVLSAFCIQLEIVSFQLLAWLLVGWYVCPYIFIGDWWWGLEKDEENVE